MYPRDKSISLPTLIVSLIRADQLGDRQLALGDVVRVKRTSRGWVAQGSLCTSRGGELRFHWKIPLLLQATARDYPEMMRSAIKAYWGFDDDYYVHADILCWGRGKPTNVVYPSQDDDAESVPNIYGQLDDPCECTQYIQSLIRCASRNLQAGS